MSRQLQILTNEYKLSPYNIQKSKSNPLSIQFTDSWDILWENLLYKSHSKKQRDICWQRAR